MKGKLPWISIMNIVLILIAIPLVNPIIRRNGDSASVYLLGVGATLVAIFLIDLIVLMILKGYRKSVKNR